MAKTVIPFLASCLLFSCNQTGEIPREKTPLLQDSSVQTNAKRQIRLEKVSEIHLREREEAYIGDIRKIKVDDNRIFLMDKSLKQILMFSKEGGFVRAMGRSGEGPGEFRYLYTMDVKDHLVACFDQGTRRITLFDTLGVFIRSFGTQTIQSVPSGNRLAITRDHTILHCQQPVGLPKKQWRSYTYPWLICEFDTLGNVLSYHGKFNQEIVGHRLDKPLAEFEWSFPQFIATGDSQTYLWFFNLPLVVKYNDSNAVSRVFNVETPITKPRWVDKNAEKNDEKHRYLSKKERANLAFEKLKNEHSTNTTLADIAYVTKHSLLLVLQTVEIRRDFPNWTRSRYLSAYDVNTGHCLMGDTPIPTEISTIAVDTDGFVYHILNDQSDDFVIAKYEIVLEEI